MISLKRQQTEVPSMKSRLVVATALFIVAMNIMGMLSMTSASTKYRVLDQPFSPTAARSEEDSHLIPSILHFVNLSPGFPTNPPQNSSTDLSAAELNIQAWKETMEPIGWKVMVWDNNAVNAAYPMLVPILKKLATWSWMSDLLRYQILYDHGGIYLDTDIVPMVNSTQSTDGTVSMNYSQAQFGLEALRHQHNFTVCEKIKQAVPEPHIDQGYAIPDKAACGLACNAVIGVTPHHPALHQIQQVAMQNSLKNLNRGYSTAITGPNPWTDVARKTDFIVFLHPDTFYPCKWNRKKTCVVANFLKNNYTFAMHQWSHSWAHSREKTE